MTSVRWALSVGIGAFAAQLVLAAAGPYDVSLVVTGAERVSNVAPPTMLLALHCTWMSCAFVLAAGALQRWALRPRVWRVVSTGNGGAMTLYLWHIPAIAVSAFGLSALGLDAYDVHAPDFWALLALRAAVFAVVMFVFSALVVNLGMARDTRQQAQGSADAAALAAGNRLYKNGSTAEMSAAVDEATTYGTKNFGMYSLTSPAG